MDKHILLIKKNYIQ